MVRGGSSLDLTFEPQTPPGKALKAALEEARKVDRDFEAARHALSFDTILSPKRLGEPAGLRQSQEELTKLRKAYGDYYGRSLIVADRLLAAVASVGTEPVAQGNELQTHRQEAFRAAGALFNAAQAILTFAEKTNPVADPSAKFLLFGSSEHTKEFDRLVAAFQKAARDERVTLGRIVNLRQVALDQILMRARA